MKGRGGRAKVTGRAAFALLVSACLGLSASISPYPHLLHPSKSLSAFVACPRLHSSFVANTKLAPPPRCFRGSTRSFSSTRSKPARSLWRMQEQSKRDNENAEAVASESSETSQSASTMAWVVLFLLLGINVHNQWTRAMVYYLVSFKIPDTEENEKKYMNIDLNFGEEQYSILASFGFTALYTFCSLIAGRASDKGNRAFIVLAAAAAWSLSTAGQGIARSFEEVLGFRSLMGISQAFTNPPAYGIIASSFPESQIATANSVFASAVYIGGAMASLSILVDQQVGWRMTCLASGALGCLIAAAGTLFLRDPRASRQELGSADERTMLLGGPTEAEEGTSSSLDLGRQLRETVTAIKGVVTVPAVQILFAASAIRFCAGYGIGVWKAPLYREMFPTSESEFSVANAFVISCGGVLSSLLGG
eukprot:754214-Hanusia_phi.AAC.1